MGLFDGRTVDPLRKETNMKVLVRIYGIPYRGKHVMPLELIDYIGQHVLLEGDHVNNLGGKPICRLEPHTEVESQRIYSRYQELIRRYGAPKKLVTNPPPVYANIIDLIDPKKKDALLLQRQNDLLHMIELLKHADTSVHPELLPEISEKICLLYRELLG